MEKGEYKSLYLKPKPDQFDEEMLNEHSVVVSGVITVMAIDIKKAPPREKPPVEVLSDSE